jgi:hypothetical protein
MGQAFGAGYTGPANEGFASIAGLGAALANVAGELVTQANAYDDVEQRIADAFAGVAKLRGSAGGTGSAGTPGGPA